MKPVLIGCMLGFSLINDGENLGEILEVIEQPHQVLCGILLNGKEALIPIHPRLRGSLITKTMIHPNFPIIGDDSKTRSSASRARRSGRKNGVLRNGTAASEARWK